MRPPVSELRHRAGSCKGFTLLEVLIAFTIMAMIMGILVGVMRLGVRSWEKGQERVEEYQHLRVFMEQMIEDIRSAYQADSEKVTSFVGESDRITFQTATTGLTPRSNLFGIRRVSYYVDSRGWLVMEENFPFDEEAEAGEAVRLYGGVDRIGFRYYRVKGELREWVSDWDSKDSRGLPLAVEITIEMADDEDKAAVPSPMVVNIGFNRILDASAAAVKAPGR
jgi:general secretion pathway protein J